MRADEVLQIIGAGQLALSRHLQRPGSWFEVLGVALGITFPGAELVKVVIGGNVVVGSQLVIKLVGAF